MQKNKSNRVEMCTSKKYGGYGVKFQKNYFESNKHRGLDKINIFRKRSDYDLNNEVKITIPFWKKYTLSIEEASQYFRIGENKLRKLISENPNANYILWNGSRAQIKRDLFEHFIDSLEAV